MLSLGFFLAGAACEKNVVEKRDKKEKINDSDSDNDLSE